MSDPLPFQIPPVQKSQQLLDAYISVRSDTLKLADATLYDYYCVETQPSAVMALVKTKEGKWVINREYRHPTQQVLLCCPGGLVDPGETPLQAAKRELLEESGFVAENWREIGAAYPFPGLAGQQVHYFLADNAVRKQAPEPEPAELFDSMELSPEELQSRIIDGEPVDGILCSALFFAQLASS